ncbi:MAG: hypothetical protein Q7R35_06580 [Elusimicrobiota bacterium]|nr:hypothetical protein [Elusimicrobiota bacterium]
MNIFIAIVTAVIVSAANVSAQDFSALEKTGAAALAAIPAAAAPKVSPPVPAFLQETMRSSYLQVDKCWTRDANPEADKLGLPAQFCLSRVGIEVPQRNPDIFDGRSSILVESKDGLQKIFITGYARNGADRTVIGSLFSRDGSGKSAFAAIYFISSLNGTVRGEMPEIRGFILDSSSRSQEIAYRAAAK